MSSCLPGHYSGYPLVDINIENKHLHSVCPFQEVHETSLLIIFLSYAFQVLDHLAQALSMHMN